MSESNPTSDAGLDSVETLDDMAEFLAGGQPEPEEKPPTPEAEDDTQELESEETQDEDSISEESEIEDDDSWGSALGIDDDKINLDEDGNFTTVNVKVNGETSEVNVGDLITSYQTGKAVTQKSQQLSEEKKQFDKDRDAAGQLYQQELSKVTNMAGMLQNQLLAEYNNVDWDALRVTDPAEYAAARQDYASKAQNMQNMSNQITQQQQQADAYQNSQAGQAKQQFLQSQTEVVLANNPTWADKEVMDKEVTHLRKSAAALYGVSDDVLSEVTSATQVAILQDAIRYREGAKVADKKMSKPLPKFQKSTGRGRAKRTTRLDKLTKRAKASQGANRKVAETDAIAELLTNGL